MKRLVLVVMVGCSAPSRELVKAPAPVETATGSLLWVKPVVDAYTGEAPPQPTRSQDPTRFDRLMVFDVATGTSTDLREALTRRPGRLTRSGDAAYLIEDVIRQRVSKQHDGLHVDDVHLAGADVTVAAVAPDETSVVALGHDGLCVVKRDTDDCTAIALPFDPQNSTVTYTSGDRVVVVSAPKGSNDIAAVGMGLRVEVAVLDLVTKRASRIDVTPIEASVSPDGRLAWNEQAGDKLVLFVAPLDHLATRQTFALGPAIERASGDCTFAGERILCVVYPSLALVSIAPRAGTVVTLVPANVTGAIFPSPDGRWVIYASHDKPGWLITPSDRAAPHAIPLPLDAIPSVWLR